MVESVYWNVGPSQTAPYGAASSPKGRAKVASLHTMSNKIPFIGTRSRPTWREANSLPYSGLSKNLPAKLQFIDMTHDYNGCAATSATFSRKAAQAASQADWVPDSRPPPKLVSLGGA